MNRYISCGRVPRLIYPLLALLTVSLALSLLMPIRPAHASGFLFQQPPNLVTPVSGLRNNIFYVGQPVMFALPGSAAVSYNVCDYWGNVVDQGPAGASITINVQQPGWYKLNLFGAASVSPWGNVVGGTTFVIFRSNPNFPVVTSPLVSGASPNDGTGSEDEVLRGVAALGPQRHPVSDATQPAQAISVLSGSIALDKQYYIGFNDPIRPRDLLLSFPNGGTYQAGVTQIVSQFQGDVRYYEPHNEPNFITTGSAFATGEMKTFYQTVKSVNPNLRVLGPGVVSLNPGMLTWMDSFFAAGGGNYIDGFSFHAYNTVNGDLTLARTSLNGLNALLAKYGQDKKEKWQTEQGYMAAVYGAYEPRHQGRWTMLQMMVFEQYGIPKEHNHLWYDVSHGYWDEPMFTENADGSLNPAAPLMRVWSEELYGTRFSQAYDLGPTGNKMYIGSLFQGPSKSVAAFMSAGGTDGQITLQVQGGSSIHTVSAFGVGSDLPVSNGQVTLPVPEIPVYVELAAGQTITPVPIDWGPDLATLPGVTVQASGSSTYPLDSTVNNDINKIHNGVLENWYYTQGPNDHPWMSNVSQFPATVEVDLPAQMVVGKVAIYCPVPWLTDGSLLDYSLQYYNNTNGQWVTISHTVENPNSYVNYTPSAACTADSYYSDRCIFTHQFAPVTTQKLRLLVNDCTWGGSATQDIVNANAQQTGPHQISLREIEIYPPAATGPVVPPAISLATPVNGSTVLTQTTYPVTATVQPGTNPILRVDFYANGTSIGTATSSPYTINWQPTVATPTVLTAVVTDTVGYSATSAPTNVTVNLPTGGPGQVRYFPRPGYDARMVGGHFQGSNDGTNYTDLYIIPSTPLDSQWTVAPLSADPATFRYLRYLSPSGSYDDVSEIEFDTGSGTSAVKLTGTPFGSPGSYGNTGATFDKAFDSNTATFFDAPTSDGNFTGIDRGTGGGTPVPTAGQVRYFPRPGYAVRMLGGHFQGSNDGTNYTDLYVIPYAAADGQWTAVPLSVNPATYRYLRYLSPSGSYGDVAEIEFDTGSGTSAVKLTGTGFGSPGSYGNSGNTFANALDGNTATFFDAPTSDGNFVGIDRGIGSVTQGIITPITVPNIPPTVAITAPATGATITKGVSTSVTATASDSDGTVASVAFYANGTLVGSTTTAPYAVGWTPTVAGPYSLTAVATDNQGAATTSAPVSVTVTAPANVPPTVSLTSPTSGATVTTGVAVPLAATASDSDGTVASVAFYANGTLVATDPASPYTVTWTPATAGPYSLTAVATDNQGATTTSTPVSITVSTPVVTPPANIPPTVAITAPTTGATITKGVNTSITATASDSDGTVASVAFYAGATLIGTATTSPYTVNWTPATTGPVSLTAIATDNSGATTTSAAVSVTVTAPANVPPTVSLTSPTSGATVTTGVAVPLAATASDSDGTVASVAFYANGTLVGTTTTAPYAVGWTPTTTGTISLTAVATDNQGATTTSAPVSVTVAAAPPVSSVGQVRFFPRPGYAARMVGGHFQGSNDGTTYTDLYVIPSAPSDGQWTAAPLSVNPATYRYLRYLSPSGSYGNVAEVEFDTGSGTSAVKLTGTGFGSPGSYGNSGMTFANALDGNTATFFDAPLPNGNFVGIDRGTGSVTPPANVPPTVSITSPTNGTTITKGMSAAIAAAASDSDGTVASVSFYANGTLITTDPASPYTATWTPAVAGPYSLTAVATDNQGATTTSAPVSVTVAAAPPVSSVGQVRFFPRPGYAARMVGGRFQGSNDGVSYTDLYTVTAVPTDGQWTTAPLSVNPAAYRYLRYLSPSGSYGNVAEVEFDTGSGTSAVKLTGTGFGSPGSYGNNGMTFANALDGYTATFFDAPTSDGNFVGIDRGTSVTTPPAASAGQVRFFPRPGYAARMVGGHFQGSNDGTNYTDLYVISSAPSDGQWTAAPLSVNPATYRYLRYLSPSGSYGNVAEVEFDTGSGTSAVKLTGTGFGSPGSYGNSGMTFANALDGNTATFFDAPLPNGNFVGIATY